MGDSINVDEIWTITKEYNKNVRAELYERWKLWKIKHSKREVYEAIGGLLARMVTLAAEMASAPTIWNGHVAPIILRTMVDTYIKLAWILKDRHERAKKYIDYGLGQEKLEIEHRKKYLEAKGSKPDEDESIKAREEWLNSQKYSFLTKVKIGSWSGIDSRKMAEEAGCLDLHIFAYTPFSAATHSTWQHVGRYNLEICSNPLHGLHRIPIVPLLSPDFDFLYRAAKYVEKAYRLFDKKTRIKTKSPSAFKELIRAIDELAEKHKKIET